MLTANTITLAAEKINIKEVKAASQTDADNDGMPDDWESQYGLDTGKNDAYNDPDSDGLVNLEEYQHHTNPTNPDSDGDGMPDGWEVKYGLDPMKNDAYNDPDSDGISNIDEYLMGTNPSSNDTDADGIPDGWEATHGLNPTVNDAGNDPDDDGAGNYLEYIYGCDPLNNDTDTDGIPDGWEIAYGLNPTNPADAYADYDGDLKSNLQEYKDGTNPREYDFTPLNIGIISSAIVGLFLLVILIFRFDLIAKIKAKMQEKAERRKKKVKLPTRV